MTIPEPTAEDLAIDLNSIYPHSWHVEDACDFHDRLIRRCAAAERQQDELRKRLAGIAEMVKSEAQQFRNGAEQIGHGSSYTLAVAEALEDLSARIQVIKEQPCQDIGTE